MRPTQLRQLHPIIAGRVRLDATEVERHGERVARLLDRLRLVVGLGESRRCRRDRLDERREVGYGPRGQLACDPLLARGRLALGAERAGIARATLTTADAELDAVARVAVPRRALADPGASHCRRPAL